MNPDYVDVLIHNRWVEKPLTERARNLLDAKQGSMENDCVWCEIKRGYICTREKGHRGPHIAHGNHAVAVWTDAP